MLFNSYGFIVFFPIVVIVYFLLPKRISYLWLLAASYYFYMGWNAKYALLLLASTIITYVCGVLIQWLNDRHPDKISTKKWVVAGSFILNLAILFFFKYFNFTIESINAVLSHTSLPAVNTSLDVLLPVGISFYTFQALSYVIDVYRGEVPAQHNFWHMLLYISFFPQLIAGPIVKYRDIAAQITGRKETIRKFAAGIMRFCWGLGKKVLLANSFARVVDEIFKYGPYAVSRKALWLGAILYMMQIYYDFSGYSDMAIGLGKMFGFEFQENFNYPYTAGSVQEFWHRWHISLSSWFRDYVYIPLGGNRKGAACTYRNLLIVFFLTGMWHGAGIAFILWGLYHGLFLILERVWLGKKLEKLPGIVGWGYTVTAVFFGWILFRAENISLFFTYVRNMFVAHGGTILLSAYLDSKMIFLIVMGVLFAGVLQKIYEKVRVHSDGSSRIIRLYNIHQRYSCRPAHG